VNLSEVGPLIHFESPLAVAIFPSKVWANFSVTNGKPVSRYRVRIRFLSEFSNFKIFLSVKTGIAFMA
jgi:hypothetical protein